MKILAAIITHNRCELLRRCVNALNEQSLKLEKILVINNSSTDGTESFLLKNKIDHINQKNEGSANGWHTAISYAKSNNFDYLWLMDDDGYPEIKALENLLNFIKRNQDYACISSILIDDDDKNTFVFPMPILDNLGFPKILSRKRKIYNLIELQSIFNDKVYPYAQLFNGALISNDALRKVINVDKNYYIFGEEVDFYWNLRKYGKVGSLLNAFHYHPNVNNRKYTETKVYYYLKNSIINNYKHLNSPFFRSLLNILILLIRIYKRNGYEFTKSYIFGNNKKIFYKSIYRGFKKKLKKDHHELF